MYSGSTTASAEQAQMKTMPATKITTFIQNSMVPMMFLNSIMMNVTMSPVVVFGLGYWAKCVLSSSSSSLLLLLLLLLLCTRSTASSVRRHRVVDWCGLCCARFVRVSCARAVQQRGWISPIHARTHARMMHTRTNAPIRMDKATHATAM